MKEQDATTQQWEEWNRQGFIPGPDENEDDFATRVAFCKNLEPLLIENAETNLPFQQKDLTSKEFLQEVFPLTQKLYGIQPQWVPLFFSNYQLAPWHGGCAWIFQLDENSPTAAFLQLRSRFREVPTYLHLYQRQELMAHELAHVGRMLYQEPQFEEILAYQSSSSGWRRWFGPIVQSSQESLIFILALGLVVLADLALLSLDHEMSALVAWWIKLIPLTLIVFGVGRLIYRQNIFKRCLNHLKALYPDSQTAQHLIYRLQDHEIRRFARLFPSEIKDFMHKEQNRSWRWRFLTTLYPLPI